MTDTIQDGHNAQVLTWDARVVHYEVETEPLTRYFAEASLALAG